MSMIVFEGCDNSGKTTLSQFVAQEIGFRWTKEPNFSSEEADRLNFECKDPNEREALFLESRIGNQSIYRQGNIVLDRYIWTGLSYCKAFTPEIIPQYKAIYTGTKNLFVKPSAYIYVDVDIEKLYIRRDNESLTREHIQRIHDCYMHTMPWVADGTPIFFLKNNGSLEEAKEQALLLVKEILSKSEVQQ